MKLRDYQRDAVQSVFDYYGSGKKGNPIIVAATGAGKSLIIGALIKRIMSDYQGQRIIMVTHIKELIEQNYSKIVGFWPDAPLGIYSAGIGRKQPWADIVCGGVQSMYKKAPQLGHRDLILVDECHLLSPQQQGMYMKLINELKKTNPALRVIGFSATPWRLKGGSLISQDNAIFTDIIYNIGIKELVERKYLSPLISKSSVIQANLTGVKMTAGEFNLKQAEAAVDNDELTQAALDEIEKLANDRKHFLFFCAGIHHSEHVRDTLRERGWCADIITCATPKDERARLLRQFKEGKTKRALVNNAVLTTGVDLPNIDCIVLLRATASSVLYIQMLGRGMRLNEGKENCLVLDYAGNIERFGAIDLIEPPKGNKKKGDQPTSAPQKICPECREPIHISKMECACGYIFPDDDKAKHDGAASSMAIMSSEIKPFKHAVIDVKYAKRTGPSGIPYLRVSYYSKIGIICHEAICFEHKGYAREKAIRWIIITCKKKLMDYPKTIDTTLALKSFFKQPTHIYTKPNGKFLEVTGYEF